MSKNCRHLLADANFNFTLTFSVSKLYIKDFQL